LLCSSLTSTGVDNDTFKKDCFSKTGLFLNGCWDQKNELILGYQDAIIPNSLPLIVVSGVYFKDIKLQEL
jgi:hypothetical protein